MHLTGTLASFSFKRGIYLVTLLQILVLPDMLGVADQTAHILAPRKQRRVNLDENTLPSARAQVQACVHASHPPITKFCPITVNNLQSTCITSTDFNRQTLAGNAFSNTEGRKGNR